MDGGLLNLKGKPRADHDSQNSEHHVIETRWNVMIEPLKHSKEEEPKGIYSGSSFASSVANYNLLKNLPPAIHIQEHLINRKSKLECESDKWKGLLLHIQIYT